MVGRFQYSIAMAGADTVLDATSVVQAAFFVTYFLLYLVSARTAHRLVGYFEEQAVTSDTLYLAEIEQDHDPLKLGGLRRIRNVRHSSPLRAELAPRG